MQRENKNNIKCLHDNCYVPDSVLSTLYILAHLTLTTTLWNRLLLLWHHYSYSFRLWLSQHSRACRKARLFSCSPLPFFQAVAIAYVIRKTQCKRKTQGSSKRQSLCDFTVTCLWSGPCMEPPQILVQNYLLLFSPGTCPTHEQGKGTEKNTSYPITLGLCIRLYWRRPSTAKGNFAFQSGSRWFLRSLSMLC